MSIEDPAAGAASPTDAVVPRGPQAKAPRAGATRSASPDTGASPPPSVGIAAADGARAPVIKGILQVLRDAPEGIEMVAWGGMMHDVPLLLIGAMRHGLTLPKGWGWMSLGGSARSPHIDFARTSTGGFKMKPVQEAEMLTALDIPAKVPAPALAVARMIYARQWETVQDAVSLMSSPPP